MSAALAALHNAPIVPAPFRTVDAAWIWAMQRIAARRDGTAMPADTMPRSCEPADIINVLDRLYRNRRVDLAHVKTMRRWGEAGSPPPRDHRDARDWREAMNALDYPLRARGIVQS